MKKLVSLFVTVALIFSLFTFSVAFATEGETDGDATEPSRTVTFVSGEFSALSANNPKLVQGTTSTFSLDTSWLLDATAVAKVFDGINYVLNEETEAEYDVTSESDIVRLQYLRPDRDYKDDSKWTTATLGNDIGVSTTGWWGFRYIVKLNGSSADYDAKSDVIYIYFSDDSAPNVTGLSTDMINVQGNGVKVGSTYTIRTNLSISDTSSTTVTYLVYKRINGVWTENPIYDSSTREVAEGFEDNISTSGVLTFLEGDVYEDKTATYKIVYSVKDSMGYVTEGTEMTIFVIEADSTVSTNQIIQYVLYAVAGLSAIGIVVVLFIKPKQPSQKADDSEK